MKIIIAILLFSYSVISLASDINCSGKVLWAMDYPGHCNGNTAFKTTSSNGQWICSISTNGNAIVLTALTAAKKLEVYIDSINGTYTCATLPNYVQARYVIINP